MRREGDGTDEGRRAGGIACADAERFLDAHVEGELRGFELALLERHLRGCAACAARHAELERERVWILEEALASPALPESFAEKVISRIVESRRRALAARWRETFFRISGVAAAAASLAVAALLEPAGRESESPAGSRGTPAAALARPERWTPSETSAFEADGLGGECDALEEAELARGGGPGPLLSALPPERPRLPPTVEDLVFVAYRLGPRPRHVWIPESGEPCRPDPNSDGKSDMSDVAYSLQFLLPDRPLAMVEAREANGNPDCVNICLRL